MYKVSVLLLVLFAVCIHQIECGVYGRSSAGSGGVGVGSSYVGKRNSYLVGAATAGNSITTTEKPLYPRDSANKGFSAWGLIFTIIAIIILAFTLYYGVICYPFLCRTEKNYQFMDVSSTMTAATSRSIQSMDNFQIDANQKH